MYILELGAKNSQKESEHVSRVGGFASVSSVKGNFVLCKGGLKLVLYASTP